MNNQALRINYLVFKRKKVLSIQTQILRLSSIRIRLVKSSLPTLMDVITLPLFWLLSTRRTKKNSLKCIKLVCRHTTKTIYQVGRRELKVLSMQLIKILRMRLKETTSSMKNSQRNSNNTKEPSRSM